MIVLLVQVWSLCNFAGKSSSFARELQRLNTLLFFLSQRSCKFWISRGFSLVFLIWFDYEVSWVGYGLYTGTHFFPLENSSCIEIWLFSLSWSHFCFLKSFLLWVIDTHFCRISHLKCHVEESKWEGLR